ncbi:MAG: HAMP domain-containing histidine kinase [Pigmentiphaga sp.]|nr:HAMP domain-containing histidine kinase [Pigmentiphaga sp.]
MLELRRSLAARILVALVLVGLLGFASLAWYLYDTRDELRYSTALLQANAIVQEVLATKGTGTAGERGLGQLPRHYGGSELFYTLYSAGGEPVWYSDNLVRPMRMRPGTLEAAMRPLQWRTFRGRGRVIGVPVTLADGGTLIVAKADGLERSLIDALLRTRLLRVLIGFLVFCLVAGLLIGWLLRWTLRPVRQAAALAGEIHPGAPQRRVPLDRLPQEIVPLARAANLGLDRLAQALSAQKQWLADAAHELRTPLTVLDLRLQKMRLEGKTDWPAVEQEVQRLRHLVDQLLTLARQDHAGGDAAQAGSVSLSRIVRETIASLVPLFEQNQRDIQVDLQDHVRIVADAAAVRDAIRNVVENALLHGQGTVAVRLSQAGKGGGAILDVGDEGAGVPLDAQDDMFNRFHKGRQGGAGSGLGLAIARQALRNLGGDVHFVGERPCVVRLRFPATSENGQAVSLS